MKVGHYKVYSCGMIENTNTGRVLKHQSNGRGYMKVTLSIDCIPKQISVHRLVAKGYCNKKEGKNQVNHIDGNKSNNNYLNLEWVDSSENHVHALKTGLRPNGKEIWNSKFTKEDIEYIKRLKAEGKKQNWIAGHMNTTKGTISQIINNKRYKYI
jgi:DNA-binding NarL/FixJ family response regulator